MQEKPVAFNSFKSVVLRPAELVHRRPLRTPRGETELNFRRGLWWNAFVVDSGLCTIAIFISKKGDCSFCETTLMQQVTCRSSWWCKKVRSMDFRIIGWPDPFKMLEVQDEKYVDLS